MKKAKKILLLIGACGVLVSGISACEMPFAPPPAPSHTHAHTATITQPTCTAGGYTTYTCECGDTYVGDEVPALGHTETVVKAGYPAKCGEDGLTDEIACSVCGETLATQEVIEAKEHNYLQTDFSSGGYIEHKCAYCQDAYRVAVEDAKLIGYTVNEDGETCTITGIGATEGVALAIPGWIYEGEDCYKVTAIGDRAFNDNKTLKRVIIGENIESIGERAFYSCDYLQSVVIGQDVKTIGKNAFANSNKIKNIVLPDGVETVGELAFAYIDDLQSLEIGNGVKEIGKSAFRECGSLTDVTLGENLQTIGVQAFYSCKNLGEVVIPDSVETIGDNAFYSCYKAVVSLGEGVTTIGTKAFSSCRAISSIVLPESLVSIGADAFQYCQGLTIYTALESQPSEWNASWNSSKCAEVWDYQNNQTASDGYTYVVIDGVRYGIKDNVATVVKQPQNMESVEIADVIAFENVEYPVTTIAESAFNGDYNLKHLRIGNNVTSIGANAFYGCSGLETLVIGDKITEIRMSEFEGFKNLKRVEIGANVSKIWNRAFMNCTNLESVVLGGKVDQIGDHAFQDCTNLSQISLPNGLEKIGAYSFKGCVSLTEITLPQTLRSIQEGVFSNCSGLEKVTVCEGLQSLGYTMFYKCKALREVVLPESLLQIKDSAFYGCSKLQEIHIPQNVTSIGENVFYNCRSLTEIIIPASVTTMSTNAFSLVKGVTIYCEVATKPSAWSENWKTSECVVVWDYKNNDVAEDGSIYTMIDGVRYGIKDGKAIVTKQADGVKTVVIPNEISFDGQSYPVTEIVESAFASHDDLEKVVIGNNVTKIGKQAFGVTPTLMEAYVGSGVVEIGESVFTQNAVTIYCKAASLPSGWNAAWAASTCPVVWDCENNDVASDGFIYTVIDGVRYGIKESKAIVVEQQYMIKVANILGKITYDGVEYPVTEIQNEAFDSCKALRSVTIGEGVEKIGTWAFRECSRLTSIAFADSVKTVEMAAFLNCTALTSVDLNKVETLGGYVFRGCDALTKVIMPKTLQTVGAEIFMECYDLMIYLEVYARPSGWSTSWNSWYNEVWDGSLEWDPYGCPTYVYSETEPTNASLKAWRYENGEIVEW